MIKAILLLLIGTLTTNNLFAVEAGDYCIGGKCYSKRIKPKDIKKRKDILKVDDSYELGVSMEIEQQIAEGRKAIIVSAGVNEDGEYDETYSYYNLPNELEETQETVPKFFCPDKKTLYCDKTTPTESDCRCV
jgi:hypothetical protein